MLHLPMYIILPNTYINITNPLILLGWGEWAWGEGRETKLKQKLQSFFCKLIAKYLKIISLHKDLKSRPDILN